RGNVKIETNQIDDQVLLKSDGYPTYHLANVIDDHLMKITHIIRGEEWLTSVPKHIILYNAFGWEVPKLAHVPLILNPDKTKLSKRQVGDSTRGDVDTEVFLNKGYLKEALLNFIALLGWNPGEGESREIFSKEELIKLFTIEKVNSSGAVFNIEKLNWMNGEYMKNYDLDKLTELALPFLKKAGIDTGDYNKTVKVVSIVREYIKKLDEIAEYAKVYYQKEVLLTESQRKFLSSDTSTVVLTLLMETLNSLNEITPDVFRTVLNDIQKQTGIKGKNLYQPIRLALTGQDHGTELGMIAYVLEKDEILRRIASYFNSR
ncbi:MAG: glutamate--tRNA ligase, partial [Ignavibacteria bacterium]